MTTTMNDNKFSPKLLMWYHESYNEKNFLLHSLSRLTHRPICQDFALYPQRFYKTVEKLDHKKTINFCFIGAYKIDNKTVENRKWILDFIRNNFTDSSYLQFTDKKTKENYQSMGNFDYTLRRSGFVPKEHPIKMRNRFDEHYFKQLSKSQFTLCPAGDAMWSMRFYEALMCKSIPIVNNANEIGRSRAESELDYKYYLTSEQPVYREDWVEYNYEIFLKYHTLENLGVGRLTDKFNVLTGSMLPLRQLEILKGTE